MSFNPLSASDVNSCHDANVAGSGCSASYRLNINKNDLKICYKNGILHFVFKLSRQKSS